MCTLRTEQLDTLIQVRDAEGAGMRKEKDGAEGRPYRLTIKGNHMV